MSSGHPLLRVQSRFAAKLETTAGTAVALSGTDGAMIVRDPALDYDVGFTKRPKPGSMTQLPGTPQSRRASIKATCEMMGLGSSGSPLWATTLLAASGFSESTGTFTPVTGSSTAATLSCGLYTDGRLKQAAGCMFDAVFKFADGMPGMAEFTGEGCYIAPTATPLITPTYPTVIPPVCLAITATIGGTQYTFPEIEISLNNELYLREDVSKSCGYLACAIVNRGITVRLSPEALALGTKDFYADMIAGTEAALSVVLGGTSNNIITFSLPKIQLQSAPQDGDRSGVLVDDLVFQANANSGADDSEISIVFS